MTEREISTLFDELHHLRGQVDGLRVRVDSLHSRFFIVIMTSTALTILVGGAQLLDRLLAVAV